MNMVSCRSCKQEMVREQDFGLFVLHVCRRCGLACIDRGNGLGEWREIRKGGKENGVEK